MAYDRSLWFGTYWGTFEETSRKFEAKTVLFFLFLNESRNIANNYYTLQL